MQLRIAAVTITGIVATAATMFLLPTGTIVARGRPAPLQHRPKGDVPQTAVRPASQSFEDLRPIAQYFADELGRFKEQNQTISPDELGKQADAENCCEVSTLADPGKKLDAETIYAGVKPGVVVVGGLFKCNQCNHWHVQCASGFVVRQDGLILTNHHAVEGFKKLEAIGVMTDDGRVFPVKAVLASSRIDDLALLKVDAENLQPLSVADDVSTGATVYCLSHPILPNATTNCFYTFSQGIVCRKLVLHSGATRFVKVLAVTADYGPGSSGGPIVNDHGAVVAVACQAIPLLQKDQEKNVQMIWKLGRPSCSILAMLSKSTKNGPSSNRDTPTPESQPNAEATMPVPSRAEEPTGSGIVNFELRPCDLSSVGYYRPVRIELGENPPVRPKAEPRHQSSKLLYGVVQLGDAANNRFLVAVDEPKDGTPKIYIDRNGSGDLTHGPGDWDRSNGGSSFVGNVAIDVPYPTGRIPYKFSFFRNMARQPNCLFYYRNSGREGEVVLDGNRYRVLVMDDNSDGRFDDLQNGTLIIDLNQDGKLEATPDSAEYFRLSEPFNARGKAWEVASLSPDGLHIALRRSRADVPIKPYLDVGYPAPEFSGRALDGKPIDLKSESARSRYVLLDFWASWCGPCRGEFPTLRRVYARYKNYGLTIIGINLDSNLAPATDAAKQAMLTYRHVFDGLGWKNAVALLYRVHGIPQVYLLDNRLKIVGKGLRGQALEKRLQELLGPGDEAAAKAVDQSVQQTRKAAK